MSAAGHIMTKEDALSGMIRETKEELGINTKKEDYTFLYQYIRDKSFELAYVYLLRKDIKLSDFHLQKEEVSEVKWMNFEEFKTLLYSNDFVPHEKKYKDKIAEEIAKYL